MLPTWQLMWHGVRLLRELPAGDHVAERRAYDRRLFGEYGTYLDDDGRPQARRDHAVGAARRLARMEEAQERYDAERAYDDPLVMAEYELTGEAFTGVVTAREEERTIPGRGPDPRCGARRSPCTAKFPCPWRRERRSSPRQDRGRRPRS
ncbi:hypothetical protein NQP46_30700 [Streptomyces albus]|nr:hypothetical protein NQP46_30700 [Streptomyces albus]